ncbi:hypothetical protein [Persephonella sp.]
MRNVKKVLLLSAIVSFPFMVYSCGDSGTTSNNSSVSTLSISVNFSTNQKISPQFISTSAQCIGYSLVPVGSYETIRQGTITPDNPSVSITVPTSNYYMSITVTDGVADENGYCTGNLLDYVQSYVALAEGSNNFTVNMIGNAKWELVDEGGKPSPIVLNKLTALNETINYFTLVPNYYYYPYDYYYATSIDTSKPIGYASYKVTWRGENLPTNYDCPDSQTCITSADYAVQFIGPDTSKNSFEVHDIELSPYTDGNGEDWDRTMFIVGLPANYDAYTAYYGYYGSYYGYEYTEEFNLTQADGTDVIADLESRFNFTSVTSSDTMEGIILEVATKRSTYTENYTCSWDANGTETFTCPGAITATGLKAATLSALSSGDTINSQALDSNNCYMDVSLNETFSYATESWYYAQCQSVDLNGDGVNEEVCDYNLDGNFDSADDTNGDGIIDWSDSITFYVTGTVTGDIHVCVYPFKAKASEITESDLNVNVQ